MAYILLLVGVALTSFFAGSAGVALILLDIRWSQRNLGWGIGFGAGLLIGLSFLEILPTAMELAPEGAMFFALIGFMSFFLIERFTMIHRFEQVPEEAGFLFSKATFVALCLHAILDGIVIGLGLHLNETFGLIIFAAILFHKLPLSISVASVFLGKTEKKTAVGQMFIFAAATPVGLVAAVAILRGIPEASIGLVVALSAGIFFYLGATDMLPEITHGGPHTAGLQGEEPVKQSKWLSWEPTLWVFFGLLASFLPALLGLNAHHH